MVFKNSNSTKLGIELPKTFKGIGIRIKYTYDKYEIVSAV